MRKPRVYWTYYPKLKRGFWRVSPMPLKPRSKGINADLWAKAHLAVQVENERIAQRAAAQARVGP